ncbi:MAG: CPBP family intramembrane glutamic endopeptidase [Pirellulales bacterium]
MKTDVNESRRTVFGTAVAVEGGLVLLALVVGWLLGQPPLEQIEWTMRGALVGLAAAVPMVAALVLVTRFPLGPLADLENVVRRLIVPLFRSSRLVDLAAICALAGLGEEMLFRGVAQAGIERASGSPWLALSLASVLFGLAHPITRTYAVLAGLIGVYLGWLLVASGNLLVPIVTHAAYDFLALVYLLRASETPPHAEPAAEAYGDEWSI